MLDLEIVPEMFEVLEGCWDPSVVTAPDNPLGVLTVGTHPYERRMRIPGVDRRLEAQGTAILRRHLGTVRKVVGVKYTAEERRARRNAEKRVSRARYKAKYHDRVIASDRAYRARKAAQRTAEAQCRPAVRVQTLACTEVAVPREWLRAPGDPRVLRLLKSQRAPAKSQRAPAGSNTRALARGWRGVAWSAPAQRLGAQECGGVRSTHANVGVAEGAGARCATYI